MREVEIGCTVLGRRITAMQFAPPAYAQPRPAAVLVGAMHGDEPLGTALLIALARDLIERPPGRETWLVPALDIDGLAAGTQNNAHDVDLERNFAASGVAIAFKPGCSPGPAPESEPETQALVALIERARATRLVSLHSTYRRVEWYGQGRALAEAMAELNGYPVVQPEGAPAPGSFAYKYGVDRACEVIRLEMPYLAHGAMAEADSERAFAENRAALRYVLDLPT